MPPIAPSRAIIAHVTDFSGKVLVAASEESGDLEIELGIKAEQQSDHHRQRERNVESGPVHGGGLAEPAEE
jgi:hypothetical protein